ncbi:MAG TPA: YraN family protein [Acidobacteriaceae bacterium]|jgi:putative endonuclease|nr:YraN family protein [Acidobacteriaceae bacterium]
MFLRLRINLMESAVSAIERAARRRRPERAQHLETGLHGERAAFFWLLRRGYVVVARAWHSSRAPGDLDIIAWKGDTLCFIEVKTRTTRDVAPAHVAVDQRKRRVLRRLARHYVRQLKPGGIETRFDILSIYFERDKPPDFEHFPDAFGWAEATR